MSRKYEKVQKLLAEVKRLNAEGYTHRQIAEKLGLGGKLSAYASRQKAACELHRRHGVEVHEIGLPLGIDLPKVPEVSEACVVDECVYGYALLKRVIVDLNCCVWLRKLLRQHPHTAAVLPLKLIL